jgi:hypothetical protein
LRKELFVSRNNKFFSFSNSVYRHQFPRNVTNLNNSTKVADQTDYYYAGHLSACVNNSFNSSNWFVNQDKLEGVSNTAGVLLALTPDENGIVDIEVFSDKDYYNFILKFNFTIGTTNYNQFLFFGDMFNGKFNTKEGAYCLSHQAYFTTSSSSHGTNFYIPKKLNQIYGNSIDVYYFTPIITSNDFVCCIANTKKIDNTFATYSNVSNYFYNSNISVNSDMKDLNKFNTKILNSLNDEINGKNYLLNFQLKSIYNNTSTAYVNIKKFNFGFADFRLYYQGKYLKINDIYYNIIPLCNQEKVDYRANYHKGLCLFIEITKEEYIKNGGLL